MCDTKRDEIGLEMPLQCSGFVRTAILLSCKYKSMCCKQILRAPCCPEHAVKLHFSTSNDHRNRSLPFITWKIAKSTVTGISAIHLVYKAVMLLKIKVSLRPNCIFAGMNIYYFCTLKHSSLLLATTTSTTKKLYSNVQSHLMFLNSMRN